MIKARYNNKAAVCMLPYLHSQGGVSRCVSLIYHILTTHTHNYHASSIVLTTANTKVGNRLSPITAIT